MHASHNQSAVPLTRHSLLVRITRNGDAGSWDEFYSVYYPYLHCVLRRWGISDHDACEIVQEVFIILLHALPRFEYHPCPGRFRGWLKRIVHNAAISHLRRRKHGREVSMGLEQDTGELPRTSGESDDDVRLQVLRRAMQHLRARSNPMTWRCFEEHLLNERTAADVGDELDVTPNAVYVNTSRILAQLRRHCADDAGQTGHTAGRAWGAVGSDSSAPFRTPG